MEIVLVDDPTIRRLAGRWIEHPRSGPQFEAESYLQVIPTTLDGRRRFLGSGKVRGLGPKLAARVVERFGLDSLQVIEQHPEQLLAITGIGPATVERVRESWREHRGIQQIMIFLSSHGVSPTIAVKAYRRYGPAAVEVVRANPYRLAEEISAHLTPRTKGYHDRKEKPFGSLIDARHHSSDSKEELACLMQPNCSNPSN